RLMILPLHAHPLFNLGGVVEEARFQIKQRAVQRGSEMRDHGNSLQKSRRRSRLGKMGGFYTSRCSLRGMAPLEWTDRPRRTPCVPLLSSPAQAAASAVRCPPASLPAVVTCSPSAGAPSR